MLASLRNGVAEPATRLAPCHGGYQFGARWFGCWKREGHGSLDFVGALEHSCDVYFYQIGPKLGLERLEETARAFGLGERTGVDLPQEKQGLVPDQAWYEKNWGKRSHQAVMLNLAIGQGELLVTPLQLALMAATAGNLGRVVRPHVVHEVRGVPEFVKPRSGRARVTASAEDWAALRLGLENVVSSGTGRGAQVPGIHVAGKTGTAQNPHGQDHALFVCYAPAENPTIALAIVVENAGMAGAWRRRWPVGRSAGCSCRTRSCRLLPEAAPGGAARHHTHRHGIRGLHWRLEQEVLARRCRACVSRRSIGSWCGLRSG